MTTFESESACVTSELDQMVNADADKDQPQPLSAYSATLSRFLLLEDDLLVEALKRIDVKTQGA